MCHSQLYLIDSKLYTKKTQTGDVFNTVQDFIAQHSERFVRPLRPWGAQASSPSLTGGYDRVGSATGDIGSSATALPVGGAYDSISRDLSHACWGKLDSGEAMKMIVGKPAGTYFTRISEKDGLSVIVFVESAGNVGQAKVYKCNVEGSEKFTTQSDPARRGPEHCHETLGSLLARSQIFTIPHPPPK